MTDPTDAEIEAMAEKLWDAFQKHNLDLTMAELRRQGWVIADPAPITWREVVENPAGYGQTKTHNASVFRAMARVALENETNGDEVRG